MQLKENKLNSDLMGKAQVFVTIANSGSGIQREGGEGAPCTHDSAIQ
jgi:hypothetical protein